MAAVQEGAAANAKATSSLQASHRALESSVASHATRLDSVTHTLTTTLEEGRRQVEDRLAHRLDTVGQALAGLEAGRKQVDDAAMRQVAAMGQSVMAVAGEARRTVELVAALEGRLGAVEGRALGGHTEGEARVSVLSAALVRCFSACCIGVLLDCLYLLACLSLGHKRAEV